MIYRALLVLVAGLAVFSPISRAEPIYVKVSGLDFFTTPGNFAGSRFEGNPTVYERSVDASGFSGKIFSWLAIMRFKNQADFNAHKGTVEQKLAKTEFPFTLSFRDAAGHTSDLTFNASASGKMSYYNPKLDVAFLDPTGHATLGNATVDVTLSTVQNCYVKPAVTYDGGVSIDPPLPIVTDVKATITVTTKDSTGGTEGDPVGLPEPTTLVIMCLGLGLALAYRFVHSRSSAS